MTIVIPKGQQTRHLGERVILLIPIFRPNSS